MGAGHGHAEESVAIGRATRWLVATGLTLVALAVAAGLVWLWPSGNQLEQIRHATPFAAPGVSLPDARVRAVEPPCSESAQGGSTPSRPTSTGRSCGQVVAVVASGAEAGRTVSVGVPPEVAASGLRAGDRVQLMRVPPRRGSPASFSYVQTERKIPMLWLAMVFVVAVAVVARLRGLMALIALGFAGLVVYRFMLPALIDGGHPVLVGLVGSAGIIIVVLYLTHGPSWRTTSALVGTLLGLALTATLGDLAVHACRLTGVADEGAATLSMFSHRLDLQGLLTCGIIVAGLGVLNDVTITQASAVWELRSAGPELSRRRTFAGAMRIGRDHIASTIYTIVFAYTGTSLVVLLLLLVYDRPLLGLVSTEGISEEVVRTLASATALVLSVPLTTLVAVLIAAPGRTASAHSVPTADWDLERRSDAESFDDFWNPPARRPGPTAA